MKKATLYTDIDEVLTLTKAAEKHGRHVKESDLSIVKKAAILVSDEGLILWIGPQKALPKKLQSKYAIKAIKEVDLKNACVMPGLVESHTHSVFAGNRAQEFEKRLLGWSYQQIAESGGGIISTVKSTRKSSLLQLQTDFASRVKRFVAQGVTTLESKSGYGLSSSAEMKMLEAMQIKKGPRLVRTFLGAHAKSPEIVDPVAYLQYLSERVLPEIKKKKLAERVDIFLEKGYFEKSVAQAYLEQAQHLGFKICIHADQLTHSGGAQVAIELGAQSADHLLQIDDKDIHRLAASNVTCVLLPTADLYMKCAYPPARRLIEAGACVALATDFNPGTSPTQDLALVGLLARLEMQMTLPEVIAAYTVGGAHALGLASSVGHLGIGHHADFIVLQNSWDELFYSVGFMPVVATYRDGQLIS